jgi:hypothetical protein
VIALRLMAWIAGLAVLFYAHASGSEDFYVPEIRWTAMLLAQTAAQTAPHKGGAAVLQIVAEIPAGWHVYALTQPPGGPAALQVRVDSRHEVTSAVGTISGSRPHKRHDPSFDLDTETYSGTFELTVPVQIRGDLTAGPHHLPINIRFQSCSERECRPPRTVQLAADVTVLPNA